MYRKVNINPVNDKYFMLKNTAEGRVPSDSVVEDGRDEDKKRGADIAVPRSFLCGDCLGSGLFVYPEFVVHPCECPLAGLDSGAVGRGEDADERLAAAETDFPVVGASDTQRVGCYQPVGIRRVGEYAGYKVEFRP